MTPWICIKFQRYWCVKSHTFCHVFAEVTEKLAIWVVFWSYFPVNMFLLKSLPQGLFHSEHANSNNLTSSCYHTTGLGLRDTVKFPPGRKKTKQSKNKMVIANKHRNQNVPKLHVSSWICLKTSVNYKHKLPILRRKATLAWTSLSTPIMLPWHNRSCSSTNAMGQFLCGHPKEGRKTEVAFGLEGLKPSNPDKTLPSSNHRRCSNKLSWSQGVYKTRCQKWFLARQTGR